MTLRCSWDVRQPGAVLALIVAAVMISGGAHRAFAWADVGNDTDLLHAPHGAYITHGEYVMNVGELQMNITNIGFVGSLPGARTTMSDAPSAQWPAGSGNEYLFWAGLWVGGVQLGQRLVSTGVENTNSEREIRARNDVPEDTIYEAIGDVLTRPAGNTEAGGHRYPEPEPDDDADGREDEETLNGFDDDGDHLIDEDFGQIGNQMMVTTMYDNTRLAQESYPDHTPMNLKVVQSTYAWENDQADDFVGFDYTITNIGVATITDVYIGMFADSDIGPRSGTNISSDDMVGSFVGAVRATDGSWVPVSVGFMYDAAENNRLDGYFGVAFLGHDIDPSGVRAPKSVRLRSFQLFQGSASFEQGGDPINDTERYILLSRDERDQDPAPGKVADYRFLVSAGPFASLDADASLHFQCAFLVGPGYDGMLSVCASAVQTYYGNFFNRIGDYVSQAGTPVVSGDKGRETMLCQEDFNPPSRFLQIHPDFGDESCLTSEYLLTQPTISDEDKFTYFDPNDQRNKTCAYVNLDNCFECFRAKTHTVNEPADQVNCTEAEMIQYNCATSPHPGCTGVDKKETQVKWLVGMAPPPPGMRLWAVDGGVHVFWNNESEVTPDVRTGLIDFEAYRIWRADNWTRPYGSSIENGPESSLWQLIAEYDVVDSFVTDYGDTLPLGRNTGLGEIAYRPEVLDDPRFDGLADSMQVVVDHDPLGLLTARPELYDRNGHVVPEYSSLLRWQGYPDALDTFFAVAARPESIYVDPDSGEETIITVAKNPTVYHQYFDRAVHNGFLYFYSVTATDHEVTFSSSGDSVWISGAGLAGDPSSSFTNTTPTTAAQTAEERSRNGANIFVYPNPATRDALAGFQQLFPTGDDPTGVRVNFTNLPAAHNTIKIFTLSGDLVQTITHDGTTGSGEASWNLMSRNSQEIVSGIYLYVVHSDDSRFDDFIGKFVVVR